MRNKILMLILMFVLVLPISFAAKPTQTFIGDVGLTIEIPPREFIVQGESIEANLHVFNNSNGLVMDNLSTSCLIHLYNRTRDHILILNMPYDASNGDFQETIGGGNFSQLGFYSFIVQCNTSSIGGFVSGSFEVTESGLEEENQDTTSGIAVEIFVLFLVAGVFSLAFIRLSKLPVLNELLHGVSIILGLALLLLNIGVIVTIADNAHLGVNREIFRLMWIIGWTLYIAMIGVLWKFMLNCLELWKGEKKKKRMGEEDEEHNQY